MKYEKPEIAVVGEALASIQKVDKGVPITVDHTICTENAYEADE
jgi:hypothetical protein